MVRFLEITALIILLIKQQSVSAAPPITWSPPCSAALRRKPRTRWWPWTPQRSPSGSFLWSRAGWRRWTESPAGTRRRRAGSSRSSGHSGKETGEGWDEKWLLSSTEWSVSPGGCTHDNEGEDQAQQGEQPPAVDPHQDERCHSIGLDKDLALEGGCGAAWGVNHRGDFSASTLSLSVTLLWCLLFCFVF